uniref:Uncharacterized protein n=1 Tax=Manihot esculenta TaxID=3983 RepID=A0A2C9VZM6_MANES
MLLSFIWCWSLLPKSMLILDCVFRCYVISLSFSLTDKGGERGDARWLSHLKAHIKMNR